MPSWKCNQNYDAKCFYRLFLYESVKPCTSVTMSQPHDDTETSLYQCTPCSQYHLENYENRTKASNVQPVSRGKKPSKNHHVEIATGCCLRFPAKAPFGQNKVTKYRKRLVSLNQTRDILHTMKDRKCWKEMERTSHLIAAKSRTRKPKDQLARMG